MSVEVKSRETQDIDIESIQLRVSIGVSGASGFWTAMLVIAATLAEGAASILALSVVGLVLGISGIVLPFILHWFKTKSSKDTLEDNLNRLSKVDGVSEKELAELEAILRGGAELRKPFPVKDRKDSNE